MKTTTRFIILSLLLLSACKDDQQVEPLNILEASPEIREAKEKADTVTSEIEEQIAKSEEEFEQKSEGLKTDIQQQLDTAQDEFEAKAAQVTAKVAETVDNAKAEMEEEIKEILQTQAEELKQEFEADRIKLLREQRSVSFDLMLSKKVSDSKKFSLAMKYFALMEAQIHEDSQNHERQTIVDFLNDTKRLFPKKLKLKNALRKDDSFNLYTLAITANTVAPDRQGEARSLIDMIVSGLAMRSSELAGFYESDGIVARNAKKFIYFMQVRHNALYDAVISALGGNKVSVYSVFHLGKYKVTGKGMSLKTVQTLHRMLREADETIEKLNELNIRVKEYKGRRKKLKKMRLDLDRGISPEVVNALEELRDHIQKNY